ncbi:MAG: aminopeptidase P family N-terminal domain-containing protein, partial [Desulfotomaculaceae bacterium]|nr:aminopeptidase P family N-terminal domain-containing protein [Desulfotomaculaceae bacterium]
MRYTPKTELDLRISKFQEILKQKNIDGAIIIQNADLFYFTGTVQRSHLFIPAEGRPVLMVRRSFPRAV